MKRLVIMLTELSYAGSASISLLTGSQYTHASIALRELSLFFSDTVQEYAVQLA